MEIEAVVKDLYYWMEVDPEDKNWNFREIYRTMYLKDKKEWEKTFKCGYRNLELENNYDRIISAEEAK